MRFSVWFENRDMIARGYKRMASIKYGPHAGKPGWYNPDTREVVPDEEVDSVLSRPEPQPVADKHEDEIAEDEKFTKRLNEFMNAVNRAKNLGFIFFREEERDPRLVRKDIAYGGQGQKIVGITRASKGTLGFLSNFVDASWVDRGVRLYDSETGKFRRHEESLPVDYIYKVGRAEVDTIYMLHKDVARKDPDTALDFKLISWEDYLKTISLNRPAS